MATRHPSATRRPAATVTSTDRGIYTPSTLLREARTRLRAAYPAPVVVTGRVVEVRDNPRGWITLTLADPDPTERHPPRLEVSVGPRVAQATVVEALTAQALVQVEGDVELWVTRALVQLQARTVVRVGHAQTQATYDAARAAIEDERLGRVCPPLPLFLRRVLLLAPHGTTLGDLTRDLGGWQPPELVHRSIPGDSPDLRRLVAAAVRTHRDVDVVVLARGGTIESISGWDDLELLRLLDRIQRAGIPVLAAIGHAEHTPLVYRVCGYTVRHTAEAGRWLADHNRRAALRIEALDALSGMLERLIERSAERVGRAARDARRALTGRLAVRAGDLEAAGSTLDLVMNTRVRLMGDRVARCERDLQSVVRRCLVDAERRVDVAGATLRGFHHGVALVAAADGGAARFVVGERVRIEVADATALATIDTVTRHGQATTPSSRVPATTDTAVTRSATPAPAPGPSPPAPGSPPPAPIPPSPAPVVAEPVTLFDQEPDR
jgi:exonuclease VII large subunit